MPYKVRPNGDRFRQILYSNIGPEQVVSIRTREDGSKLITLKPECTEQQINRVFVAFSKIGYSGKRIGLQHQSYIKAGRRQSMIPQSIILSKVDAPNLPKDPTILPNPNGKKPPKKKKGK